MRRLTAIVLAAVLGALAATGAVLWRASQDAGPPEARAAITRSSPVGSDRLQAALDGLRTSPLYVAPELAADLDATQRRAIVAALEAGPVPTYLVYMTPSRDARIGTDYAALDQLVPRLGDAGSPARVAIVTPERSGLVENIGEGTTYADSALLGGRLDRGLLRYAQELAAEESEPPNVDREVQGFNLAGGDYYGGLVGGFFVGLLYAGGIFVGLVLLVAFSALVLRLVRPVEDR